MVDIAAQMLLLFCIQPGVAWHRHPASAAGWAPVAFTAGDLRLGASSAAHAGCALSR
jgi:hypothetical protein